MPFFPGPANPIVYAQYCVQGRWRRLAIIAGVYGAIVGSAIWISTAVVDVYSRAKLADWNRGLMVLQFLALGLGAFGVEIGVRRDVSSRMIESNRMMPYSSLGSVLGYLVGTPLFAYGLFAVNFTLGGICCLLGGTSADVWVFANASVLLIALTAYSLITQFALVVPGSSAVLVFGTGIAMGAASSGGNVLPAVSVLVFPLLSRSAPFAQLFGMGVTGSAANSAAMMIAIAGQIAVIVIAVCVAVRRYESAKVIGITPALGLIFLAIWTGLAVTDNAYPEVFNYDRYASYRGEDETAQIVFAICSTMLLGLVPIASAALSVHRRQAVWSHLWAPAVAIAIVWLMLLAIRSNNLDDSQAGIAVVFSGIVVALFLATSACLFYAFYLLRRRAWIYVVFWIVISWLIPVIIDGILKTGNGYNSPATAITAVSPPGALALIWNGSQARIPIGIAGQAMLAVIPATVLVYARSRRKVER